jgi:hypothetical protein
MQSRKTQRWTASPIQLNPIADRWYHGHHKNQLSVTVMQYHGRRSRQGSLLSTCSHAIPTLADASTIANKVETLTEIGAGMGETSGLSLGGTSTRGSKDVGMAGFRDLNRWRCDVEARILSREPALSASGNVIMLTCFSLLYRRCESTARTALSVQCVPA